MSTSLSGYQGFKSPTGLASGLKGTGYNQVKLPNFTPEQMQLFQNMFGQLGPDSYLGKLAGGDQSQFGQLEAPAMRQFQGLQGGLASRFSGMGLGSRKSSGFQNTTNQATQDFASQLQSQRMGIQQQALRDLMGMGNQLLGQRSYENALIPQQKPWWQELLPSLLGAGVSGASNVGGLYGMKKLGIF